jgi:flavin reductase (DIM6/NTAB) family NADH-FMN oxidoreductase RutF
MYNWAGAGCSCPISTGKGGRKSMEGSIDPRALFTLNYGVYILSTGYEGKFNGQIINALMQLTADPICMAACLHKDNYTTELVEKSGRFSISVLEDAVPLKFIGLFGFRCGREFDKFGECQYEIGSEGLPLVTEYTLAGIELKVLVVELDSREGLLFCSFVLSRLQFYKTTAFLSFLSSHFNGFSAVKVLRKLSYLKTEFIIAFICSFPNNITPLEHKSGPLSGARFYF